MKTAHRRAHRLIWMGLFVAIPAMLIAAFILHQSRFEVRAPVQLEPPRTTSTSQDNQPVSPNEEGQP